MVKICHGPFSGHQGGRTQFARAFARFTDSVSDAIKCALGLW